MDFFSNFDPSDDEHHDEINENAPNYPQFTTNFHDKFWFREQDVVDKTSEVDLFRVADLFENGKFDEAREVLQILRKTTKNNRTHEVMLIDSILQCYIQASSPEILEISHLLSEYEALLVDFGDQVQFLRTKALLLAKFPAEHKNDFRNTVFLLCHLCGSVENWQLFEKGSHFLTETAKFFIKMKMEKLLKYEIEHAKGFVREGLKEKMETIRREAKELETTVGKEETDKIVSSLNAHKDSSNPDLTPSSEFRAHDSRSKNKLIPVPDQSKAIQQFLSKNPYLCEPE